MTARALIVIVALTCAACGGGTRDPGAAKRNVEDFALRVYPDAPKANDIPTLIDKGRVIFAPAGCAQCHSTGAERKGLIGPALGGVSARVLERHKGDSLEGRRWLAKHIRDPQVFPGPNAAAEDYRGLAMPPNGRLQPEEMRALVEYLWSLP